MNHLIFEVVGHPEPAGSKTNMPRRRFPFMVHSMKELISAYPLVDANPKSKHWKEVVASAARGAMLKERLAPIEGPVFLRLVFRRARPISHLKQNGELSLEGTRQPFPMTKPDVLKLARAVEDAMTGIVYTDDARIVSEQLGKEWGEPEGVIVTVMAL